MLGLGLAAMVALVLYGHHLHEQGEMEVGAALAVVPGIIGGFIAAYLMRHYESGWASFWTFLAVTVPVLLSAPLHGLRMRGLGGLSIAASVLIAGIGLVFDALNRVSAAIPLSISGLLLLAGIGALWAWGSANS